MLKLVIAVTLVLALACAKKDPFDPSFIEKDLKSRTAQDIHDAADKFTYDAPADRLLTEKQIGDFVRVVKLTTRIREVAERQLNQQVDRASAQEGRTSRLGESLAAVGSLRSYATAELRACLNLGVNPKEQQWVQTHIDESISVIDQFVRLENDIAAKKAELDAEIDPVLVSRKRQIYDQAVQSKESWEAAQDPAVVANAQLVRKHRHELTETR